MDQSKKLYKGFKNPLLIRTERPLPKEMAVIGAGTIGPDIGYYLKSALADRKLILVDISPDALARAEKRLTGYAQKAVKLKKMKEEQAEAVLADIVYTTDYEAAAGADLIIEAATEDLGLKKKIFALVEGLAGEEAIITSNTSSIPADLIFSEMKNPGRCTITHFFAPAWLNPAVEVVNWEKTDPKVVDFLFWFFAQTGKAPIITDNVVCFVLNRIFENWCNEAAGLMERATAAQVNRVAEEFVFQGPFFVLNMGNGSPIVYKANKNKMVEGEHYRPFPILQSVSQWAVPKPGTPVEIPEEVRSLVRDRLLGVVFSQAFDIADRVIGTREDLNFGVQAGLGFRQGLYDIMDRLGESEVSRINQRFSQERPGFPQAKQDLSSYLDFYRYLLIDDIEGIRVVTIRRPQAMNAVNEEIYAELLKAFQQGQADPQVKGFVLTGYGLKAFSAGADIGRFPETLGNLKAAADYARRNSELMVYMDRMEKPVVAAINGLALGGGLEIAIRCHAMTAMKNASFQFPEITIGIAPGTGGCVVPYRKWPRAAAVFHEMICLARKIKVDEAVKLGLVDRVADDYAGLIDSAVDLAKSLTGNLPRAADGPVSIPEIVLPENPSAGPMPLSRQGVAILAKTIKAGAAADSLAQALEIGYQAAGEIACTEAAREGISAFLEKRKPDFEKTG